MRPILIALLVILAHLSLAFAAATRDNRDGPPVARTVHQSGFPDGDEIP